MTIDWFLPALGDSSENDCRDRNDDDDDDHNGNGNDHNDNGCRPQGDIIAGDSAAVSFQFQLVQD